MKRVGPPELRGETARTQRQVYNRRVEAVLVALSKLEARFRADAQLARERQDAAMRQNRQTSRAYWSGMNDGFLEAANKLAMLYDDVIMVAGDPRAVPGEEREDA